MGFGFGWCRVSNLASCLPECVTGSSGHGECVNIRVVIAATALTVSVVVGFRFLTSVSPDAPAQPVGVVGFVGDSITDFNLAEIQRRLEECDAPPVTFDVLGGRQAMNDFVDPVNGVLPSGLSAIEHIEQTVDPSVWVFEIGVNDMHVGLAQTPSSVRVLIDGALAQIDATDTVYWVNTYSVYAPAWPVFNAELEANERIVVLDWAAHAPTNNSDGVHPNDAGVQILSDMYCDALT